MSQVSSDPELINLISFKSQLNSLNSSIGASLIMVNDSTLRFSMTLRPHAPASVCQQE